MKHSDLNSSEKYCICGSHGDWYAIPALSLQTVAPRPKLCRVPMTDAILAGLAHVQREFLPVFSLASLAAAGKSGGEVHEPQLLVLNSDAGPWGLLVGVVLGLEGLEVSLNTHRGTSHSWSSVAAGSASYRDRFVTVLDPELVLQWIERRLLEDWQAASPPPSGEAKSLSEHGTEWAVAAP